MKIDSTTQRIGLITVGAAVLISVIWYFALWSPQGHALAKAKADHTAANARVGQLHAQISSLDALVKQIPSDQSKLLQYTGAVPDGPQLASAIDQIQSAAAASHVTLSSIGPSGAPSTAGSSAQAFNGVADIAMSLSVTGSYQDVMSFITALDNLKRTVVINDLSLSGSSAGAQSSVSASISSYIFYTAQATH